MKVAIYARVSSERQAEKELPFQHKLKLFSNTARNAATL